MNDLLDRSALDQSTLLRDGAVSVEELTRAYLDRIARRDRSLNAFVQQIPRRAVATARALDRERLRDRNARRSPLWGLPTAMKDLHMARGTFTRLGSRAFRYLWTPMDDLSTAAVRRAGMVLTGKLSTSELAILPFVDTDTHPPTRNPWDLSRYSGGSSGGSSAAIAAGMLPIAVASDGAGSIRIPAAFCGLVGHKPTRGLLPNPFAPFEKLELSVVGPHARSVDDAAALMDVLIGREEFLPAVRRPPGRLRVRYTTHNAVIATAPEVNDAVLKVVRLLAAQGHDVEEADCFVGTVEEFMPMFRYLARGMFVPSEAGLQGTTKLLRDPAGAVDFAFAMARREMFRARIDAWFGDADLWVTPTVAVAPPRVGTWTQDAPQTLLDEAAPLGAYTAVFNASGHPATTIPVWPQPGGLPVGVQLITPRWEDVRALSVARMVMEALGTPIAPVAPEKG